MKNNYKVKNITFMNPIKTTQADYKFHFTAMNNDGEKGVKIIQNKMRAICLQCWPCIYNTISTL